MKRVLSGAVLIPLVLGIVYLPSKQVFIYIMMGVAYFAFSEFTGMFNERKRSVFIPMAVLMLLFVNMAGIDFNRAFILLTIVPLAVFALVLPGSDIVDRKLFRAKLYLTGFLYIAIPISLFSPVREWDTAPGHWMLFALVIPWICDTAAFSVGTLTGRHYMAPAISPKKTWEGFAAGFVASVLAGFVINYILFKGENTIFCLLLAAAVSLAGQVGDLAESLFKRAAGVKDSGSIIPGHGGLLDRMDSLLFSVTIVYFMLKVAKLHV